MKPCASPPCSALPGAMTYAIACSHARDHHAVAVLSGGEFSGRVVDSVSSRTKTVSYLGAHGVWGQRTDIATGRRMRDGFVRNNGCVHPGAAGERGRRVGTWGSLRHV